MNIEIKPTCPVNIEKNNIASEITLTILEKFKAYNFTIAEAQWVLDNIFYRCVENAKIDISN